MNRYVLRKIHFHYTRDYQKKLNTGKCQRHLLLLGTKWALQKCFSSWGKHSADKPARAQQFSAFLQIHNLFFFWVMQTVHCSMPHFWEYGILCCRWNVTYYEVLMAPNGRRKFQEIPPIFTNFAWFFHTGGLDLAPPGMWRPGALRYRPKTCPHPKTPRDKNAFFFRRLRLWHDCMSLK